MKSKRRIVAAVLIGFLLNFTGCSVDSLKKAPVTAATEKTAVPDGDMIVNYIDVGQGDSELIQVGDKILLIDAGTDESKLSLKKYLKGKNIKRIDYVIVTHGHEDHIGGMADIINEFEIGNFYSPKVTANTKTYENMVAALKKKNLQINILKGGEDPGIDLGEAKLEVYSPNESNYDDLNNYSPIIKITYGEKKFLFDGDAEALVEKEVIDKGYDIKADVIKIGHHGSSSSSTSSFIKKVSPEIGIISVGKDNKYKHPADKTIATLKKNNIKIYRTDEDGSIVLKTNGAVITKE